MSNPPLQIIKNQANSWYQSLVEFSPNIIAALLVVLLFIALAVLLKPSFTRIFTKVFNKKSLGRFAGAIVSWILIIIGFFIALHILNLDEVVLSLLAGAGVIGLVVGLALQDTISNFFSGVAMSVREPFRIGDLIQTQDHFGRVKRINVHNTVIETPQGQRISIPNKEIINSPIVDFSYMGERRIDLVAGISYDDDMKKAKEVAVKAVSKVKGVKKDKEIEFFFTDFGDSSINFVIRFWIDFESSQSPYYEAQSSAIDAVKMAFDKEGISIPYPTTVIKRVGDK